MTLEKDIEMFKNREVKAKQIFGIKPVQKNVAFCFVRTYHYLGDAKFFSMWAYGLFHKETDKLIGVAAFAPPQGSVSLKGWFGLPNSDKSVLELTRLCVLPELNGTNATSYLLGGAIKLLKKAGDVRAVVTLADSSRHVGSIYQVCNFKYYGLTDPKTDFFRADGAVNPRGKVTDSRGVWIPRTRKHRYAYIIDHGLKCLHDEKTRPSIDMVSKETVCSACNGTKKVFDKRFGDWYSCPRCSDFRLLKENDS